MVAGCGPGRPAAGASALSLSSYRGATYAKAASRALCRINVARRRAPPTRARRCRSRDYKHRTRCASCNVRSAAWPCAARSLAFCTFLAALGRRSTSVRRTRARAHASARAWRPTDRDERRTPRDTRVRVPLLALLCFPATQAPCAADAARLVWLLVLLPCLGLRLLRRRRGRRRRWRRRASCKWPLGYARLGNATAFRTRFAPDSPRIPATFGGGSHRWGGPSAVYPPCAVYPPKGFGANRDAAADADAERGRGRKAAVGAQHTTGPLGALPVGGWLAAPSAGEDRRIPAEQTKAPFNGPRAATRCGRRARVPTMSASIRSLFIINKAGGLVYQREFTKNSKRSANDNLVLAGTLHGYVWRRRGR